MTTIDHRQGRTYEELIAEALAALEALRQLDICDPLELTRPFRQFACQLTTIAETLDSVEFAATIDDDVRRGADVVRGCADAPRRVLITDQQ